jgi:hypothetical protein
MTVREIMTVYSHKTYKTHNRGYDKELFVFNSKDLILKALM